MTTRAKLVCSEVKVTDDGAIANPQKTGEQVKFESRYNSEDSPEDNTFSKFTPWANMGMSITNPELFGNFIEGKAYYFDITACEIE